ncbi:MAG: septum formation initiator family protein [Clostridia bacterium]|nr:septum formation initiator family protein [Clostridia bacterium]
MSRTSKKKKLNRVNVIKIAIALLVAIFVIVSAKSIISLKIEQSHLKAENQKLIEQRDDLKKQKDNIDSKEYVEKQARDVLKMVKPGEKIFVLEDD